MKVRNFTLKTDNETEKNKRVDELLPVNEIKPNPNQPRRRFPKDSLEELAESIRHYGVIQPITVVKKKNWFVLVTGERRLRAGKMAGLAEIPAICVYADEKKSAIIAMLIVIC